MNISGPTQRPAEYVRQEEYSSKVKGGRTRCTDRGARGKSEAVERGSGREECNITDRGMISKERDREKTRTGEEETGP